MEYAAVVPDGDLAFAPGMGEDARRFCGFVCHSHYDGLRTWGYPEDDRDAAIRRLRRLQSRPQFISGENSVARTERYLRECAPGGNFTFQAIPYRNHTDTWVLRDIPERRSVRAWVKEVLSR